MVKGAAWVYSTRAALILEKPQWQHLGKLQYKTLRYPKKLKKLQALKSD